MHVDMCAGAVGGQIEEAFLGQHERLDAFRFLCALLYLDVDKYHWRLPLHWLQFVEAFAQLLQLIAEHKDRGVGIRERAIHHRCTVSL